MSGPSGVRVEGTLEPWRLHIYPRLGEVVAVSETDEQRAAKVRALVEERSGYMAQDLQDRVAAVDEELRRLGGQAQTPVLRATKRVVKAPESL